MIIYFVELLEKEKGMDIHKYVYKANAMLHIIVESHFKQTVYACYWHI